MELLDAFQVKRGWVIALAGAGGKTATMFLMGEEALKRGLRVVITTTTRIYMPPPAQGMSVVLDPGPGILNSVHMALNSKKLVVAGAGVGGENKIVGVDRLMVPEFIKAGADIVLVETDGSAGRPFKAPREGEPVIPHKSDIMVPVVGVDCIGMPLGPEYVHRPEIVSELTGASPGEPVTADVVAAVYLHPGGYYKDLPPGCRWVPFINKVENSGQMQRARGLAAALVAGGADRVVIGAAKRKDPVQEIIEAEFQCRG